MPQIILEDSDGTLNMLRDSVAQFASRVGGPDVMRARRDAGLGLEPKIWKEMGEAGWLGLMLPEALGGAELSLKEQAILSEALGRALISEPLAQLSVFSGALLAGVPASDHVSQLAEALISAQQVISPVWQDISGNIASLSASANKDAIVLDGTAEFVCAARDADVFLVIAKGATDGTLMLLNVPSTTKGIAISERPSVDGATLGQVVFTQVQLDQAAELGRGDDVVAALERAIEDTRLTLAAELAGVGSRALELTVDYTKEREQFGKPIASFQTIQHRLVDMWSMAEFACAAIVNALEQLDEADTAIAGSLAVLAAKARAGDAAIDITRRAIHLHGAMGFTDECDIGLYMKRAVNLNATLGNAQSLRLQFVALERAS